MPTADVTNDGRRRRRGREEEEEAGSSSLSSSSKRRRDPSSSDGSPAAHASKTGEGDNVDDDGRDDGRDDGDGNPDVVLRRRLSQITDKIDGCFRYSCSVRGRVRPSNRRLPLDDEEEDEWEEFDEDGKRDRSGRKRRGPASVPIKRGWGEGRMANDGAVGREGDDDRRVVGGTTPPPPRLLATTIASMTTSRHRKTEDPLACLLPPRIPPDGHDRFAAHVDPATSTNFLNWTKIESTLDDPTALLFLMTFPYYEREWDLVGLLFDAMGLTHDDDDSDDAMDVETIEDDEEKEADDDR